MSYFDKKSIDSISFTPTNEQIDAIIEHANFVEKTRKHGARSCLLSKLSHLPAKFGLCPQSLNPNDTILCELGRKFGKIGESSIMTVIDDRNMPLGSTSCGPNGVLTDCQNKYGQNRINLFYKDRQHTKKLLSDYLKFRDENIIEIFRLYVNKLNSHVPDFNDGKGGTLSQHMQKNYRIVCNMFSILLSMTKTHNLDELGIGCVSFCQTWLNSENNMDSQFSVMSPHFQTRFYIKNLSKIGKYFGILYTKKITAYSKLIQHFDNLMVPMYGTNGKAFIHLDNLNTVLE